MHSKTLYKRAQTEIQKVLYTDLQKLEPPVLAKTVCCYVVPLMRKLPRSAFNMLSNYEGFPVSLQWNMTIRTSGAAINFNNGTRHLASLYPWEMLNKFNFFAQKKISSM